MNNTRRDFLKKSLIFGAFSIFAPKILTNCFPVRGREPFGIELLRGIANGNIESQKAFAAYIGPVIRNVLGTNTIMSDIYKDFDCWGNSDSGLSIPMDLVIGNPSREGCRIL